MSAPLALALLVGGCAGDDGAGAFPDLSPAAAEGWEIARSEGCTSCHGSEGQGLVGPKWVGLAGSEVELDDGRVLTADTDYLRRAIADPSADVVDGYSVRMPQNGLSEAEIDAVVGFLEEIG